MDYAGLKNAICDDGIAEVKIAYVRPDQADKLEGAIQGFEDVRATLDPGDLKAVLLSASADTVAARARQDQRYWFWRMRAAQVEWAANVVSAALYSSGLPVIIQPTARGMIKAADILGVAPR